jgi:hypothetical protein
VRDVFLSVTSSEELIELFAQRDFNILRGLTVEEYLPLDVTRPGCGFDFLNAGFSIS